MTDNPPIPCFNCGYSLQGLPPEALCPECSFPVADSRSKLHAPESRAARPLWLLGCAQLFASIWLLIIACFAILGEKSLPTAAILVIVGPLLWLAIQCLWGYTAAMLAPSLAPRANHAIVGCAAVNICALGAAAILAFNILFGGVDRNTILVLPIALFLITVASSLVGSVAAAAVVTRLVLTLPSPLRTHFSRLNLFAVSLAFASASGMVLVYLVSPWFGALIPLATAFSAARSLLLSYRLRAAIGER